jgi:hypothetical protein
MSVASNEAFHEMACRRRGDTTGRENSAFGDEMLPSQLLNELQKQQRVIEKQRDALAEQHEAIAQQGERIALLEARLSGDAEASSP